MAKLMTSKTFSIFHKLENIVPAIFLLFSVIFLTPIFGIQLSLGSGVIIHATSYLILGLCFEIPEFSLNVWCLIKSRKPENLENISLFKKIFAIRYFLASFLAPCAGLMTITSGLYLMHERQSSLTQGWLFWLMFTAIIGLYKGFIQHRFYVRSLLRLLHSGIKNKNEIQYVLRSPVDHGLIFTECPTYLFNYWLALCKPAWLGNPFAGGILFLEQLFHSSAFAGILMVGLGSLWIFPLRFLMKKYSRVYKFSYLSSQD